MVENIEARLRAALAEQKMLLDSVMERCLNLAAECAHLQVKTKALEHGTLEEEQLHSNQQL